MSEPQLTAEDARSAFRTIVQFASLLRMLPLEQLERAFERSDAVGWMHDPTAYRATEKTRDIMLRMFRAARVFVAALPTAESAHAADEHQKAHLRAAGLL